MDPVETKLREQAGELVSRRGKMLARRDRLNAEIRLLEDQINAVTIVMRDVLGLQDAGSQPQETPRVVHRNQGRANSLAETVRQAITSRVDQYTPEEIAQALTESDSAQSSDSERVRKILARFARDGDIQVIQKGDRTRPTVYRNTLGQMDIGQDQAHGRQPNAPQTEGVSDFGDA